MKFSLSFFMTVLLSLQVSAQQWDVIPAPQQITFVFGYYDVTEKDNGAASSLNVVMNSIYDSLLAQEGYIIEVDTTQIKIITNTKMGLMYAMQTLRQAVFIDTLSGKQKIACARVVDYPKYAYRGMHLDVSRHFFSLTVIKRYLDELARYKINYFHWHLTDDQGWRIEIKKYPLLTQVGAWRTEKDGKRYGGFYTKDQVREIVA